MDPAYAPYAYSPYIINTSPQKKKEAFGGENEAEGSSSQNEDNSKIQRVPPGANIDFCSPSVDKTNERMISSPRNTAELSLFSWFAQPGLTDGFDLLVYLKELRINPIKLREIE